MIRKGVHIKRYSGSLFLFIQLAVASLALAGCSTPSSEPSSDNKVTIYGVYTDAQAQAFQDELAAWGTENGISITYTPLQSFETEIKTKIEDGAAPDIAIWPEPVDLLTHARAGDVLALDEVAGLDLSAAKSTLVPGWDTLAVADGKTYALPVSAKVRSVVFYNPSEFARYGYTVPTTDSELTALVEKIKKDGSGYPFCAGIESGGATGWPITDWIEHYVLDYNGIETYNRWIAGSVKFGSDEVVQAADKVASLLLTKGSVKGGGPGMVANSFGDAAPLFETGGKAKGQCFMLRQGAFITDFFPDAIKSELAAANYSHVDVFPLPPPSNAQAGILGVGELAAAFNDEPDTAKVLQFLFSDKVGSVMAKSSTFTSPHKTFDLTLYADPLSRKIGKIMADADVFGFDASECMPSPVKAEFWAAGTDWVAGKIGWLEAAKRIQSKF